MQLLHRCLPKSEKLLKESLAMLPQATAAKAKTEAARWQAGALLAGLAVGTIATYLGVSGANAINMSTAREKVAAAELRAETAEADAKKRADEAISEITEKSGAAVAAVAARNAWASSAAGQVAHKLAAAGSSKNRGLHRRWMGKKGRMRIWRDLVLHPPKRWNLFWHNIGAAVSRPRLQKLIRYNAQMKKNTIDAKNTTQEAVKTGPGRPQKNEPGMVRVNVRSDGRGS